MSNSSAGPSASTDVLAAKRTRRPDALKSFQPYTGGWNIMNMDYLASAGYTGMPGFVISVLWIVAGFLFIVVVICMCLCCKGSLKQNPDFERFGNYTTLGLLIIFTVLTISGCGALFTGLEGLHADVSTVITYLMAQFTAAAKAGLSSVPPAAAPQAAETALAMEKATNSTSSMIHAQLDSVFQSAKSIQQASKPEYYGLSFLPRPCWGLLWSAWLLMNYACGLGVAIGTVFVAWKFRPVIYTLVTIGWLLVMGTWILCGVFLLLEAIIGDTCVAMQEWSANPRTGTSFDIIVQCGGSDSNSSSNSSHFSTVRLPPITEEKVQYTEYKLLNDFEQKNHEFYEPDDESFGLWVKKSVQRKTSSPPSNSTADGCAQLQKAFVQIFETIVNNNCPSMRRNAQWVWISLVTLSTGSTVSICLWIVFTRRSTMRLTKLEGGNIPMFQFQESSAKKTDAGEKFHDAAGAHSTGSSTPTTHEDVVNGGSRRRSKPKAVNISINT